MPNATEEPLQEFPTTRWALIGQALAGGANARLAALEELVLRYRPPLRAHLILRKRLDEESADEILQGFITEKIVGRYLLERANRDQGKFRYLLVHSLGNYCKDWLRTQAALPATGSDDILAEIPDKSEDASEPFDVAWACQVLDEVLAAMRADCESEGQAEIWGVFECRLFAPLYEQARPIAYDEICRRFGFASPEQASNALVTAKRKYLRAFRRVAAKYTHDGEEAEDILRELIGILSRVGPLPWQSAQAAADRRASSDLEGEFKLLQPARMFQLLELRADADNLWAADDWRAILRHHLAQRLMSLSPEITESCARIGVSQGGPPLLTLGDLYEHPRPPIELLRAVKNYGRKWTRQPGTKLPSEVASILYFGCIAVALVRHAERITKFNDLSLRRRFERAVEEAWIGAAFRNLFEQAIAALRSGDSPQDLPSAAGPQSSSIGKRKPKRN